MTHRKPARPALALLALLLSLGAASGTLAQGGEGELPAPEQLQQRLPASLRAEVATVVEPHLSTAATPVRLAYRGWPAAAVLTAWLGPGWTASDQEIEFRALDGYVSRIPVERFARYKAWLVFARQDGAPFRVDNLAQQEKQVALGPYYLVWDNIGAPELLAEGGASWPYQVARIALRPSSKRALLPAGLAPGHEAAAAQAQKFCLACHQVNGYGGDKMPLNLAARARAMDAATWQRWLLDPQSLKPGTAMPPLPDTQPLAERQALAAGLYAYLRALPLIQP